MLRINQTFKAVFCTLVLSTSFTVYVYAEIIPQEPGDNLTVDIQVDVTQDSSTGLYKYSYTLTNLSESEQDAFYVTIPLLPDTPALNPVAPEGWAVGEWSNEPYISWFAYKVDEVPADWDGTELPSSYQIAPGETLGGFAFESYVGPGTGEIFVQGWTPKARVTEEYEEIPDQYLTNQSPLVAYNTEVTTPAVLDIYDGNRRPAVDGFIGYLNLRDRDVRTSPMVVVGKYSLANEVVFPDTFNAMLNGFDVTHLFEEDLIYGGDIVAEFIPENSGLEIGKNILLISIDGIAPNGNTATDTDRITFTIE